MALATPKELREALSKQSPMTYAQRVETARKTLAFGTRGESPKSPYSHPPTETDESKESTSTLATEIPAGVPANPPASPEVSGSGAGTEGQNAPPAGKDIVAKVLTEDSAY
jgi:hypothetical protein